MHEIGQRCIELLVTTGHALNDGVVGVMLLAVQKGNLEVSIKFAVASACKLVRSGERDRRRVILRLLGAFPYMWIRMTTPCST